jgi:hypothetical protein
MRAWISLILGVFGSLLPTQLRARWQWGSDANLRTSTIISGVAEALISLLLYVGGYLSFMHMRVEGLMGSGIQAGGAAMMNEGVAFGAGALAVTEYIFKPLSLALVYFAIEGALRAMAAVVTDECVGTLPLAVIGWVIGRAERARKERSLGPRVLDQVQVCEGISYDLVIASCRAKEGWNKLITVEYQDQLYELYDQKKGVSPRPHIYQLRKLPPGKVVRGLHRYSPDEALTEKEKLALKPPGAAQQSPGRGETRQDKKY